ncbi:MAG TPA: hypothetical protein VGM26_09995 [Rhizomicrobium sp.]|jgi:hypothetical protein
MKHIVLPATFALLVAASICQAQAADAPALGAKSSLPQALSTDDLGKLSGGAGPSGVAISQSTLTAVNAGNAVNADSVITGNISMAPGTFNGFNGVGNFVFNTGNNNNVQGSLNVTILTPAN